MPLALADHPQAASLSRSPWIGLLTRMAEETELDGLVRVAGDVLPVPHGGSRLVVATLADALHARYFRFSADPHLTPGPAKRHSGGIACMRLGDALTPEFLGRSGWEFAYRTEGGIPLFVVTAMPRCSFPKSGPSETPSERAASKLNRPGRASSCKT